MNWIRTITDVVALATILVLAPTAAHADDEDSETSESEEASPWNGSLSVGASANLVSNDDVVGQTNGFSALIGVNANGKLDYEAQPNVFEGKFTLNETFSRTPSLDSFVQTDDSLEIEGTYKRFFLSWAGAFGEISGESSIFRNVRVTGEPTDYRLLNNDGTVSTRSQRRQLRTTELFRPASFQESVGGFATFVDRTEATVQSRLSITARETFADDVYIEDDDAATPETELSELRDLYQGGLATSLGLEGEFPNKDLTYEVEFSAFVPVLNNDVQERSPLELTRLAAEGSLTFAAFDWLSANYNVSVVEDPQLVDAVQIQNSVLLTLTYDIIERRTSKKPSTEEKLEEAQKRIESLESRIKTMKKDDQEPSSAEDADASGDPTDESSNE